MELSDGGPLFTLARSLGRVSRSAPFDEDRGPIEHARHERTAIALEVERPDAPTVVVAASLDHDCVLAMLVEAGTDTPGMAVARGLVHARLDAEANQLEEPRLLEPGCVVRPPHRVRQRGGPDG